MELFVQIFSVVVGMVSAIAALVAVVMVFDSIGTWDDLRVWWRDVGRKAVTVAAFVLHPGALLSALAAISRGDFIEPFKAAMAARRKTR